MNIVEAVLKKAAHTDRPDGFSLTFRCSDGLDNHHFMGDELHCYLPVEVAEQLFGEFINLGFDGKKAQEVRDE